MAKWIEEQIPAYRKCLRYCARNQATPLLEQDYFFASMLLLNELNSKTSVLKGMVRREVLDELAKAANHFHENMGLEPRFNDRYS